MSIWKDPQLAKYNVIPSLQLTLDEGDTPVWEAFFDNYKVWIKNEMINPNNSFKDRSLAYQLSYYISIGSKRFVISSSGNAAISAASYVALANECEIDIFIGNGISSNKYVRLNKFASGQIRIHKGAKPKSDAIKFAKQNNAINLRGSIDDLALTGFKTIGYELARQVPQIDSLFLATSSGTSALALHYAFEEMGLKVAIYVCQSEKVHPIASEFDKDFDEKPESMADAIVDKVALRKPKLLAALKKNGGGGFVLSDADILEAQARAGIAGIPMPSYNSALAFAGLSKALRSSGIDVKKPLILVSGI
jgi:threonine synthase